MLRTDSLDGDGFLSKSLDGLERGRHVQLERCRSRFLQVLNRVDISRSRNNPKTSLEPFQREMPTCRGGVVPMSSSGATGHVVLRGRRRAPKPEVQPLMTTTSPFDILEMPRAEEGWTWSESRRQVCRPAGGYQRPGLLRLGTPQDMHQARTKAD